MNNPNLGIGTTQTTEPEILNQTGYENTDTFDENDFGNPEFEKALNTVGQDKPLENTDPVNLKDAQDTVQTNTLDTPELQEQTNFHINRRRRIGIGNLARDFFHRVRMSLKQFLNIFRSWSPSRIKIQSPNKTTVETPTETEGLIQTNNQNTNINTNIDETSLKSGNQSQKNKTPKYKKSYNPANDAKMDPLTQVQSYSLLLTDTDVITKTLKDVQQEVNTEISTESTFQKQMQTPQLQNE